MYDLKFMVFWKCDEDPERNFRFKPIPIRQPAGYVNNWYIKAGSQEFHIFIAGGGYRGSQKIPHTEYFFPRNSIALIMKVSSHKYDPEYSTYEDMPDMSEELYEQLTLFCNELDKILGCRLEGLVEVFNDVKGDWKFLDSCTVSTA